MPVSVPIGRTASGSLAASPTRTRSARVSAIGTRPIIAKRSARAQAVRFLQRDYGRGSGACPGEQQVGAEPGGEAETHSTRDQLGHLETSADVQQLGDYVQDRAGGQRETEHEDRDRLHAVAQNGAQKRRTATDQTGQAEEAPRSARRAEGQGSGNAEAFGRIVQSEADDEDGGQLERARAGGLADRQAFGEVVDADARCDHERELKGARRSTHLAVADQVAGTVNATVQAEPK